MSDSREAKGVGESRYPIRRIGERFDAFDGDPYALYANPRPPVEFFARGLNVEIAWLGGETITATGNSFATPHVSGLCALVLGKHPHLTPFQVKTLLHVCRDDGYPVLPPAEPNGAGAGGAESAQLGLPHAGRCAPLPAG